MTLKKFLFAFSLVLFIAWLPVTEKIPTGLRKKNRFELSGPAGLWNFASRYEIDELAENFRPFRRGNCEADGRFSMIGQLSPGLCPGGGKLPYPNRDAAGLGNDPAPEPRHGENHNPAEIYVQGAKVEHHRSGYSDVEAGLRLARPLPSGTEGAR